LIDHIRAIEPVVVACVFEDWNPDLRHQPPLEKRLGERHAKSAASSAVASPAAAGARISGTPLLSVQRKVIAAIKKALKAAK